MVQTKTSTQIELNKSQPQIQKMSGVNFIYWLQGCFELGEAEDISKKQVQIIKEHLAITENHIFCIWLDGFLSTHELGVNKKDFKILKNKLESFLVNISKEDISTILEKLTKTPTWPDLSLPYPHLPYRDRFSPPFLSDRIFC